MDIQSGTEFGNVTVEEWDGEVYIEQENRNDDCPVATIVLNHVYIDDLIEALQEVKRQYTNVKENL